MNNGNDNSQVLVRMFFENGHIETRPLAWVDFTTPDYFADMMGVKDAVKDLEKGITGDQERYVAFTNKLTGIQVFRGTYTNVRTERTRR